MTPHRFLLDIHQEFVDDVRAAEVPRAEIAQRAWFNHVFAYHPELHHISIASGKENFGRCTDCARLEEKITAARKKGE